MLEYSNVLDSTAVTLFQNQIIELLTICAVVFIMRRISVTAHFALLLQSELQKWQSCHV